MKSKVLRYSDLWDVYFNRAPYGVLVMCAIREDDRVVDYEVLAANARAVEIFRRSETELVGGRLGEVEPSLRQSGLLTRFERALGSGEAVELEQALPPLEGARGEPRWLAITAVPDGNRLIVTINSITRRKAVLFEAVKLMNHDDLTGVGNRRLLKSHFWMKRQQNVEMSVLYFDLNGFKAVNDGYGHEMGDEVLRVVAQRLKKNIRPNEVVARLGGDEFAVLLDTADPATVEAIRRRLEEALAERIRLGEETVTLTASVGSALYPRDGTSFEALLGAADRRMYAVKRGR